MDPNQNPSSESQTVTPSQPPSTDIGQSMPTESAGTPVNESSERPMGVVFPQQTQTIINGKVVNSASVVSANTAAIASDKRPHFGGFKRKAVLLPVLLFLFLFGGAAAAYFGYYLPNQPDNLWKTALVRTGKGYDKLTSYINQLDKSNDKGVSIDGTFKVSGSIAADGTFKGSTNDGNGEFSGSLSATGLKVDLDTRLIKSANSTPDVYFKVNGLQGIGKLLGGGDAGLISALEGINNQWYFVDHTLFDQYAQGSNTDLQLGSSDINNLLKAMGGPTKKYVFTDNQQSMAFTVRQKVGKEKQDGRNTYHYKVGVDKDNLKAYSNALCDSLKDTKIFKLLSAGDVTAALSSCKDTSDLNKIKESDTADVWVDTHTKLIHKVRFSYSGSQAGYTDIVQDYQGGDSLPFSISGHSKSNQNTTDYKIDMTLNMKTNSLSLKGNFNNDSSPKTSFDFNMTIKPNNSPVKVQKPDGAKSIIQLADDLGLGQLFSGSSENAKDAERKTDINALQAHTEAYYAENGYYPTLANINDSAWRAHNMKGLDSEALKDPAGSVQKLSTAPAVNAYSYQVLPTGCDNVKVQCTDYTLTASLDSGGTYVKQSLNSSDYSPPTILN